MVSKCYLLEGDSFCAPIAYDYWESLRHQGRVVTGRDYNGAPPQAPLLRAACQTASDAGHGDADELFNAAIMKAIPAFDKLEEDSHGRLHNQLQVFRACRVFDLRFVANNSLITITDEIDVFFSVVPVLNEVKAMLILRLPEYRDRASLTVTNFDALPPDKPVTPEMLWAFWKNNHLRLPEWFKAASEVALILVSSACVERVFSLYGASFDSEQESSLSDKVEGTMMLRYNKNQRAKDAREG